MFKEKRIIYPIIVLVIGILVALGFAGLKSPPEEKEKKTIVPQVSVVPIEVSALRLNVDSHGVVKPKYETQLVAQISGEMALIAEEFVRGGLVKQGQLLARIAPGDYEALLLEAEASLASAQAALELERAQGQVAQAEWERITSSTPSELSLRKPQLAQEVARVRGAQAAVKRAQNNLRRTQIRAPYDALIDARDVGLGSYVNPGTAIGKVLSVSSAEVRLPVADNQLQFLQQQGIGAQVTLRGSAMGKMTSWQATIVRSEGVIDNKSRMAYLVAEIIDPYGLLKTPSASNTANSGESKSVPLEPPLRFGSYVTAAINGITLPRGSLLPRHLVVDKRVAILDANHRLHFKHVDVIRQDGANVVVSAGVEQGDLLINSALEYPVEGMMLTFADGQIDSVDKAAEAKLSMKEE